MINMTFDERIDEALGKFMEMTLAISGSCDDVDIIDRDNERLLDENISSIKSIIKESLPKKSDRKDDRGLCGDALKTSLRDKAIRNNVLDEIHKRLGL